MILTKLQEALSEIGAQREAINEIETQLRSMIAKLSGDARPTMIPSSTASGTKSGRDKFDDIADILRAEGKPLHITVIAERLSALTGTTVLRTEIEPGLNRHISKVKKLRIAKFAPSTYGLPQWKTEAEPAAVGILPVEDHPEN